MPNTSPMGRASWMGPACGIIIFLVIVLIVISIVVMVNTAKQATDASQKGKNRNSSLHDPTTVGEPQAVIKEGPRYSSRSVWC